MCEDVVRCQGLIFLVELIDYNDYEVRRAACLALGELTQLKHVMQLLEDDGLIVLIQMFDNDDAETVAVALKLMCAVTQLPQSDFRMLVAIGSGEVLEMVTCMVTVLTSSTIKVDGGKIEVVEALYRVCSDASMRMELAGADSEYLEPCVSYLWNQIQRSLGLSRKKYAGLGDSCAKLLSALVSTPNRFTPELNALNDSRSLTMSHLSMMVLSSFTAAVLAGRLRMCLWLSACLTAFASNPTETLLWDSLHMRTAEDWSGVDSVSGRPQVLVKDVVLDFMRNNSRSKGDEHHAVGWLCSMWATLVSSRGPFNDVDDEVLVTVRDVAMLTDNQDVRTRALCALERLCRRPFDQCTSPCLGLFQPVHAIALLEMLKGTYKPLPPALHSRVFAPAQRASSDASATAGLVSASDRCTVSTGIIPAVPSTSVGSAGINSAACTVAVPYHATSSSSSGNASSSTALHLLAQPLDEREDQLLTRTNELNTPAADAVFAPLNQGTGKQLFNCNQDSQSSTLPVAASLIAQSAVQESMSPNPNPVRVSLHVSINQGSGLHSDMAESTVKVVICEPKPKPNRNFNTHSSSDSDVLVRKLQSLPPDRLWIEEAGDVWRMSLDERLEEENRRKHLAQQPLFPADGVVDLSIQYFNKETRNWDNSLAVGVYERHALISLLSYIVTASPDEIRMRVLAGLAASDTALEALISQLGKDSCVETLLTSLIGAPDAVFGPSGASKNSGVDCCPISRKLELVTFVCERLILPFAPITPPSVLTSISSPPEYNPKVRCH